MCLRLVKTLYDASNFDDDDNDKQRGDDSDDNDDDVRVQIIATGSPL